MCTHVREQTHLPEGFAFRDIADVYFHHGHFAVFHRIPQRHACMRVPACIQHDTIALKSLYLINQIAFVI